METIAGLFKQIKKEQKVDKIWFLSQFKNQFNTNRERELLIEAIKSCNKRQSTLYIYYDENQKPIALINLEFDKVYELPIVSVGYLFVAKDYRKQKIKNLYLSQILVFYTIKVIIPQIQDLIQFSHLGLYPDQQNEKLINHYLNIIPTSYKIKDKKDIWIFIKVK